jgi:hypothetical protein
MGEKPYDLAVSFAGEQRNYVAYTVTACKRLGLKVFYDRDKNNDWWGGNFIREQRAVYGSQARFFAPFNLHRISVEANSYGRVLCGDDDSR